MPQKSVKLRVRDYLHLKRLADKREIPLADMLSEAINKLEAKKLEKMTLEFDECDDCGYKKVPKDATFCPNCGVEFETEDEDEDEEDEDEDEE
jgi:predicted Zn-ribbon and HTH transcriptional regulator